MNKSYKYILVFFVFNALSAIAQEKCGANIPWITYETESMKTNGKILGPRYDPYRVETESSGQECVTLGSKGEYIEFIPSADANSMVIRFSLPDAKDGNGTSSTLSIYKNGHFIQHCKITSYYSWLYGKYPFSNDPSFGVPRHFYDEIRIKGLSIEKGDTIKLQRDDQVGDNADYCILDLVDLENIAPPLPPPANALFVTDKAFGNANTANDYTIAFRNCIAKAVQTGQTVWIPEGTFKITGDITLPENIRVQGAGMWYSQLVGDEAQYTDANKRVRLIGTGSNIHISDFSLTGALNYRSDKEANDGIVGSYGTNSTISNIWIEHTKVGMWIENSMNLKITGCRMRNTMADGINFCVGMSHSTIENCSARSTGDDCFAIWPTTFMTQLFSPGNNLVVHCTGQLPYLANGGAVYGGESNKIENCLFTDISQGSAILISTTFPTESRDKSINNNFSGVTVIDSCEIKTSGGFDHEWDWRGAIEICLDKRSIAGLKLSNLKIENSLSNAISIVAKNVDSEESTLSDALFKNINISGYGLGTKNSSGLFIASGAHGGLSIEDMKTNTIKNDSQNFVIK